MASPLNIFKDSFVSFSNKIRQICLNALDTPLVPIGTEFLEVSHPLCLQKVRKLSQKYGMHLAYTSILDA